MALSEENKLSFKIHFILLNKIRRVIKLSLENEIHLIKKCKNQSVSCKCMYAFFDENFNKQKIVSRKNKRNYSDIDLTVSDYLVKHNQIYPNNFDLFDLTLLIFLARNILNKQPKNGWIEISDLDLMSTNFPDCLNTLRNIRNKYHGHLNDYIIESIDYEKMINIFNKIVENMPNLDKQIKTDILNDINKIDKEVDVVYKAYLDEVKEIISETRTNFNKTVGFIEKIITKLNKKEDEIFHKLDIINEKTDHTLKELDSKFSKTKLFRCDSSMPGNYSSCKYVVRNESEIIKTLLDVSLEYNIVILIESEKGMGSTSMASYVSKYLINKHDFLVKHFKSDQIYSKYLKILKNDFNYDDDDDDENLNDDPIGWVNHELREFIRKNDRNILFVFDEINNDEEIKKYIIDLPKEVRVLITTKNKNLLKQIQHVKKKIHIDFFTPNECLMYFKQNDLLNKEFNLTELNKFVTTLVHNIKDEPITPLKLEQAVDFILTNSDKEISWIINKLQDNDYQEIFI